MFYPFPRHRAPSAPPMASPCVYAPAPPPPPQPPPPPPPLWVAPATAGGGGTAAAEELELSEELIASFVRMEERRGRRRQPHGSTPRELPRKIELPQQEHEASRAVLRERAQLRDAQEERYGPHTPAVRALEAGLNAAFDAISHKELPALWPSVPLCGASSASVQLGWRGSV